MPALSRTSPHRTLPRLIAAGVVALGIAPAWAQPGGPGSGLLQDRTPGLPNTTPEPLKGVELRNKLGSTIPLDLEFTTSDGKPARLKDLFGKAIVSNNADPSDAGAPAKRPVVLMLMYFRCPMLCPMVMDSLTRQMRQLDFTVGSEFDAVVVSFDERDTPKDAAVMKDAALISYGRTPVVPGTDAEKVKAASVRAGWTFLTGPASTSRSLADALGFGYRYLPESGQFAHGAAVFILTPEGKVSRYVTNLAGSSTDLRLGLVDASSGAIGSWTDQLMLRCLHFNPDQGGYTMSIMRGVQIAALLGVGALGGTIATYLVLERRRRRGAAGSYRAARFGATHRHASSSSTLLSGNT